MALIILSFSLSPGGIALGEKLSHLMDSRFFQSEASPRVLLSDLVEGVSKPLYQVLLLAP